MGTNASNFDIDDYIRRNRVGLMNPDNLPPSDNAVSDIQNRPQIPESNNIQPNSTQQPVQLPQEIYKPGSKMAAYESDLGKEPLHQDFHPSTARKVLSTLAGVLTGIAGGGVSGGIGTANYIRDSPYRSQLNDYNQKLGIESNEAGLEAGHSTAAQKYYSDLAKIQHENAQANQENQQAAYRQRGNLPEAQYMNDFKEINKIKHPSTLAHKIVQIQLNDGTSTSGKVDDSGTITDFGNNPIDPTTIKHVSEKDTTEGKLSGQLGELSQAQNILDDQTGKYNSSDKKAAQNLVNVLTAGKDTPKSEFVTDDRGNVNQVTVQNGKPVVTPIGALGKTKENGDDKLVIHSRETNGRVLNTLSKPIEESRSRLNRLESTLSQGNPQADALVAPELLTVIAGGQGSGLRMSRAEIERAAGGHTALTGLEQTLNHLSTNPGQEIIPPAQRLQIKNLIRAVGSNLDKKSQVLNDANDKLGISDNPKEHFKIVSDARKALSDADRPVKMIPYNGKEIPETREVNGTTFKFDPTKVKYVSQ